MNCFYLMLKNTYFVFRRTHKVFHFFLCSFLFVFISSRFHLFSFLFLFHFTFFLLSFLQMFLHCLCCYHECYGFERTFYHQAFFALHFFLLPDIWQNLLLSRLPWGRQFFLEDCRAFYSGSKHRLGPFVGLNQEIFGNYMISMELYLNFSKYVDKLLVVKSLINFNHIS